MTANIDSEPIDSWLAGVPAHWSRSLVGHFTRTVSLRNRPDLPLLSVVRDLGVIERSDADDNHNAIPVDLSNYKAVETGHLVLNKMKTWQGSLGVSPFDGIVSPAYIVCRLLGNHSPRFIHYLLRSHPHVHAWRRISYGVRTDQWDMRYEDFRRVPAYLPPRVEQDAIVAFLDQKEREIAEYIATKQRMIEVATEQRGALIQYAMTRGIRPSADLQEGDSPWLGRFPTTWRAMKAKQICAAIVDCKNRTPTIVENGRFVVVRTSNVRHGVLDLSEPTLTDEANYRTWTMRGPPRQGDVFFTREAPAGEACLVPENDNLCMGQRMMYFRPDPAALDPEFLLYTILGPVGQRYIDVHCFGSTVGHLKLGQVYDFPVLWCPVDEQREIVSQLKSRLEPLLAAVATFEREIAVMQEYRTALIADVVTGRKTLAAADRSAP